VIVNGDVSKANALGKHGMLALPGQVEHRRLGLANTGKQQQPWGQKPTDFLHERLLLLGFLEGLAKQGVARTPPRSTMLA